MFKSVVYQGNCLLGEAEIYPKDQGNATWNKEIRISHLSSPSDRCPPLAVLHTIATDGVCFRMESKSSDESPSPIFLLHATCLRENKTAVISIGELEIHLVAMASKTNLNKFSSFWAFSVPVGLYGSCVAMLNLRCLGIVFDLDETLIVANTMRSFEDRIDALQRKINTEMDPQRVAGMLAEVKRYQDDKSVLKQYVDNDQVVENDKVFKTQSEMVPPLSDSQQPIIRPLIRLPEKNIILTRVNPAIRDTSVLVRLRPGWDDLRNYLTARGRKRFEVYVCTMAERDYALEMWRLLDPESNLISVNQLLNRIVCVKSGLRKSLLNVFHNITCHPRMALVIDDRMKVWDDKDQPRVHVVPAFTPYYAPQAETNGTVPVLCVARNVACNVRGNFFKEFDDGLLPHISKICYEDDMSDFPSAPDVGNYLISEDETAASIGNKDPLCFEGVADAELDKRLKEANVAQLPSVMNNLDPRLVHCLPHNVAVSSSIVSQTAPAIMPPVNNKYPPIIAPAMPMSHPGLPEPAFQGSPAREEGEVPESELDPDTRRRLLILQHGQDTRDHTTTEPPPMSTRQPLQGTAPPSIQPHGSWFPLDENLSPRRPNRTTLREYPSEPEPFNFDKKRSNHSSSFLRGMENSARADRGFQEIQRFSKRVYRGDRRFGVGNSSVNYDSFRGEEMPDHISSSRDIHFETRRISQYSETPTAVLEEIGNKCGAKVEFKTALVDTTELQFSVEVWFVGEKICESTGRTRKEAQRQAAESSLRILANKYLSDSAPEPSSTHGDLNKFSHGQENGFPGDLTSFGYSTSAASASALKELCSVEGLDLVFHPRPSLLVDPLKEGEVYVQAEVDGQVLGKGISMTWEEAKLQASEEALANLKSSFAQFTPKHVSTPRSLQMAPNKRLKADFSRDYQRTHSSRYLKNENFVP